MSEASDPVADFQDAMAQAGIITKQRLVGDGKLHRIHIEGDSKSSKTGFYTLHLDGRPAGAFGCWKRGIKETWKANGADLSNFELAKLMRQIDEDRRRREREEARLHKAAAEEAAMLWASYQPAPADHPYLARKQIDPHGVRVDRQGRLVVAVSDVDGNLWSLQTIDVDGNKLFMPSGRKKGCLYTIGEPSDRIVIVEGFATGASIHEATGLCVAVAFDAGNLEPVARAIRARRPAAQLVIAADDDCETKGNPGLTDAGRPPAQSAPPSPFPHASSRTARSSTSTTSWSRKGPRPSRPSSWRRSPNPSLALARRSRRPARAEPGG